MRHGSPHPLASDPSGSALLPYDEGGRERCRAYQRWVADRSMWQEHLVWLAEAGLRAIAVDLPGFGDAVVEGMVRAPWEDVLRTLRALDVAYAAPGRQPRSA